MINPSLLLRRAIQIDAVVSGAMALLLTVAAGRLAPLLQLPEALLLESGLFLIVYVALIGWLGFRATMPKPLASRISRVMSAVQKRAAAAGSIISPTASSVPSAWKPATRFRTTRARKVRCTTPPERLTERRKPGSTHSITSGR